MGSCLIKSKVKWKPKWIYDFSRKYDPYGTETLPAQEGNPFNLRLSTSRILRYSSNYSKIVAASGDFACYGTGTFPSSGNEAGKSNTVFCFDNMVKFDEIKKVKIDYDSFDFHFNADAEANIRLTIGLTKTKLVASTSSSTPTTQYDAYTYGYTEKFQNTDSKAKTITIPAGTIELDTSDVVGEYYLHVHVRMYKGYAVKEAPVAIKKVYFEW